MNNTLFRTLWFLGGLTTAHFLFEWLFGLAGNGETMLVLDVSRFGIYAAISIVYALFRSRPQLYERDKALNS